MNNVVALKRVTEAPRKSGKGFALMYRQIMDCDFYKKDSEAVHLWLHLILKANSNPGIVDSDVGEVMLSRGQLMTSRAKLCAATGIEDNKMRALLRSFKSKGMISSESKNNQFSVITVLKYDEFQGENCPTVVQPLSNANPDVARDESIECPTVVQDMSINNNIYNITTSNDVVGGFSDENNPPQSINKSSPKKSKPIPYQAMIDAYHEILPEMARVTVLRDGRKSKMRTFWQRASREVQAEHGKPFTLDNWRSYLRYISGHCRWMMEDRPNGKGGYWRAKNLDYLITDQCYVSVKEDRANDRNRN
ncbi:DNA replication protein [Xenorhabdus sp. Flor]|uniref:DNA replication protein n=1 Tax=Xenorhabdus cabanillasii TaxID=351673 RepID=UPI0019CBE4BE|nr:DNA replication protein [Xenorhabdus sp. Flor]MBD2815947.1 DNA replication protein [Xenorhabdus sp. Flor]